MYRNGVPGADIIDLQSTPTTPPTGTPALTGKYRRNGKLQSCEPCRKSKLRCDHTVPVCGRCIKRRCVDQCVYHPNPLTQRRGTPTRGSSIPTPSASHSSAHNSPPDVIQSIEQPIHEEPYVAAPYRAGLPKAATPTPGATRIPDPPAHSQTHRAASAPPLDTRIHESVSRSTQVQSFFGATSYSSIFSEGLGNIELMAEAPVGQNVTITPNLIARGCEVLTFLAKKRMINEFASRWYEICEESGAICIEPIMKEWLLGVWVNHSDTLTLQNPEKLRRLSERIWRNTLAPLNFNGKTTAIEFARLATGQGLRWEVVGLIATNVALFTTTVDGSDDSLRLHKVNRQEFCRRMFEVSEECLGFSRYCSAYNDLYCWLLIENAGVSQAIKGDTSFTTYRASGELLNLVVSMGLHQGSRPGPELPFFLSELRNKLAAATYSIDVSNAAFLGRPPRLSYRYCTLIPPLDLTDHEIALEGPELAAALAQLDENGNHTGQRLSRMTYYRACWGLYMRREDIVDLALADYTREEVLARAETIHRKTEEFWQTVPPWMAITRSGPLDLHKMKPLETLQKSAIRQGFRANELLLQRVLIRKTGASPERLIEMAREIFDDILLITQRHDIASLFRGDVTMILVVHGLRSAATLAVELLKQERLPEYPEKPLVPRSQTIQDLSIFAGRLGAVDPSEGSYSLCQQGRKLVTRILDQILAPKPPQQPPQRDPPATTEMEIDNPGSFAAHVPGLDVTIAPMPITTHVFAYDPPLGLGNDLDFMQWLQNTDMEQANVWNTF